uniref:Lon N-terminal domain-containing protein n=1 Tax=Heterorhabditis bacteriophora TaxID=37862 RepID=A0A1I7X6M9_HETBA
MAQYTRRFLRAQFDLTSPIFLPITYGSIFQIFGKSEDCSLDAMNIATGQRGLIPRSSEAFYVEVHRSELPYVQPVIIIGSFSSHIQDLLVERKPEMFTVPVARKALQMLDQNLFIDCAELAGNLYGVSEAAIRLIAQKEDIHNAGLEIDNLASFHHAVVLLLELFSLDVG